MKVKVTAIRTIGWRFKGETKIYDVQKIEDRGDYYALIINSNREVRVNKENWEVRIC